MKLIPCWLILSQNLSAAAGRGGEKI